MGARIVKCFLLGVVFCIATSLNAQRFLDPTFETETVLDINYGAATNYLGETEILQLDFYEPLDDTLAYRPLIVYVHGGGFTDVAQTKSLIHIAAYSDSMASRGYVVASINYRLDTTISNRAVVNAMHDARAAIRFFRANYEIYKIDTNLIFIGGESAGAVTALNVNYIDNEAEVNYPPVAPYSSDLTVEGSSGNGWVNSNTKATLCFCGGTETIDGSLLFDTLAIDNTSDPALLMVHGSGDPLIPISKALDVAVRANNVGLPNLFYNMPGATHCPWFYPLEDSWEYLDTLIDYTVPFLYACVTEFSNVTNIEKVDFKAYPNPTNDNLTVSFNSAELQEMFVYAVDGRLITRQEIKSGGLLNVSSWSSGIYLIALPNLGITYRFEKT